MKEPDYDAYDNDIAFVHFFFDSPTAFRYIDCQPIQHKIVCNI